MKLPIPGAQTPDEALAIAVVGHTNAGKTSLLRTLTRKRRFGEVSDRPGTTRHVEVVELRIAGRPALRFFDTPGLEDSVALWDFLQGAAAGPMVPLSQSLLLHNYPENKRGLALAFWAMTTTVAPIVGPFLGGWITDNMSWPWIFYINVPVGIL
mgnify:CR=1 FL=1